MADGQNTTDNPILTTHHATVESNWNARYGAKHRWVRLTELPAGIQPPQKVRVYRRVNHFILQWWDPAAKRNLSTRVDGDLLAALMRAREIDSRIAAVRTAGVAKLRRLTHGELVEQFIADLNRRADAGEIDACTVRRYHAALGHYLSFSQQMLINKKFPSANKVDREFRLGLAAFLADRRVGGNGRGGATLRPMRGQRYILETVRAMYEWALDPDRGNLLPHEFRSPFLRTSGDRVVLKGDPLADPDITLAMALDLVRTCDAFQLRLFVPMLLFGFRAAEPCFLFHEFVDGNWLRVPNILELNYKTKSRREKRFPLIADLASFWHWWRGDRRHGLVYERRSIPERSNSAQLHGAPLAEIIVEFQRRLTSAAGDAGERRQLRQVVLRDAGALSYDEVQHEFLGLARRLNWPRSATLKDLRHLFATSMANAGMPEGYRQYLMGHSPGRSAILHYTHLDQVRQQYSRAIAHEWSPLVTAILYRIEAFSTPKQTFDRYSA